MNAPNTPQRVVLVTAAVAVLALAFYPPFFPRHIRSGRFDIELAAVTLATIGLLLALRGLPKFSLNWRLPNISLAPAGWKRLWIVFSLIYLSAVVGISWRLYPTYSSEEGRTEETRKLEEIFGPSGATDVRPPLDSYFTRSDSPMPTDLRTPAEIYSARLSEQREFVIRAALWWVCPLVAIYLLGMAWCWVSRGFRPVRQKDSHSDI